MHYIMDCSNFSDWNTQLSITDWNTKVFDTMYVTSYFESATILNCKAHVMIVAHKVYMIL
jgi:hypothetical protein